MLMSMTGFGKREIENADINISVEVKSINSRYLEVNHKIPRLFSDDEENVQKGRYEKFNERYGRATSTKFPTFLAVYLESFPCP